MYAFDLSYDPRDPWFPVPGPAEEVRWAVQVFTVDNVYGVDPDRATLHHHGAAVRLDVSGLSWAGQQRRASGTLDVTVELDEDGVIVWNVRATHTEPIKAVKILLRGLPASALDAGWWHATSPDGTRRRPGPLDPVRWRYPWPEDDPWPEWETPWACAGPGTDGTAVCVSVRDTDVRAKRLFVHRPPWAAGDTVVEVVCEELAPKWRTEIESPAVRVRLAATADDVDADFEAHLGFVAGAFGLVPWEQRTDVPAWFHATRLVLNLHGRHWTGYVFNTYEQMAEAIRFVAGHIPGEHVLAYLPGWEGRYYHDYPWYEPDPELGGAAGFAALIATAHELGTRVMPMFGIHGANALRYPEWEQAGLRTRTGRSLAFVNHPDWDGDRSGEDDQLFLNPGEPGFRRHLIEQVSAVIERFGVDGVFLDTSACWFNDPRHDLVAGYRQLLADLRAAHPDVLFAGEGWYDAMLGLFPVNQSWLGTDRRMRYPQLLTRFARAVGHLSTGAPGTGSTGVHEGGFYPSTPMGPPVPGHLHAVSIVDGTIAEHGDEVAALCRSACATW